jgi:hypothetical protein
MAVHIWKQNGPLATKRRKSWLLAAGRIGTGAGRQRMRGTCRRQRYLHFNRQPLFHRHHLRPTPTAPPAAPGPERHA